MNEQRQPTRKPPPATPLQPLVLDDLVTPGAVCDIDDPDCDPGIVASAPPAEEQRAQQERRQV
jgi:hypothetical protein